MEGGYMGRGGEEQEEDEGGNMVDELYRRDGKSETSLTSKDEGDIIDQGEW
jgi:hypothetical protein